MTASPARRATGPGAFAALTAAVSLTLAPAAAAAQDIELGGQVRPRTEFRSADWFDTEVADAFTSMRTRLSVAAGLPAGVSAFVQIQDVRIWGEEESTTEGAADMLDFHQAWLELGDPVDGPRALRLGRQELAYGEERLVGVSDWGQTARAFDGGRFRLRRPGLVLDGFATRLLEDEAGELEASFYGLHGTLPAAGPLELYALYNTVAEDFTDQLTLGGRWQAEARVSWRVEAAYQTGTRARNDVSAYLVALRAGLPLGERGRAELWYDRLSGDDERFDEETGVFDTLFGTNHKFYGLMDLFTNIPVHTSGRGLQDIALKTTFGAAGPVAVHADLHVFLVAAGDGLDSGQIGEELDLTARWSYAPGVAFSAGGALFRPGDAGIIPGSDVRSWLFLMADVVF